MVRVCSLRSCAQKRNPASQHISLCDRSVRVSFSWWGSLIYSFSLHISQFLTLAPTQLIPPFLHPVTSPFLTSFSLSLIPPLRPHTHSSCLPLNSERSSCSWAAPPSPAPWRSQRAGPARWWWPSWSSAPPPWRSDKSKASAQTGCSDLLTANEKGERSQSSALIFIRKRIITPLMMSAPTSSPSKLGVRTAGPSTALRSSAVLIRRSESLSFTIFLWVS